MSDVDDPNGILVRGPWSGDSSYVPPPMPDYSDTISDPEDIPEVPPESPEETTMELPPIPAVPDPEMALRSDGITVPESGDDDGQYEDGEYVPPRSLADRLGDWLELRLEMARALHEGEAPFREAEIARKTALLEGRTAQEVAMMEQNGKLHAAMMKAKGDKAAARGKADADRMKSTGSGLGADKGRSKAGGGGGPSRGNGNSGGSGGRSGSGQSGGGGKGGTKGSDRSSGGRASGSGRNGASGGSRGSHAGSGSSGRNGNSKGDSGRAQHGPASNARAERARGRQERAASSQGARQERRTVGHAAGTADRTKNRDQARANRQQVWEDRRAKKAERDAARKSKLETAASTESGRTTLRAAVSEEAQRRWDKRRADEKDGKAGAEKVSLSKDQDQDQDQDQDKDKDKDKDGDKDKDKGAEGKDDKAANDGAGEASKAGDEPSDGSKKRRRFRRRRASGTGWAWRRGRTGRAGRTGGRGRSSDSPFGPDESAPNVEWPDRPTRTSHPADSGVEDIKDAVIVPDGPASVTTGVKGLPSAPELHTQRPGTSQPTRTEGSSVSSAEVNRPSGQGGLAAQHRTDITFDEYLVEMANISIQAASDQERAEALMEALGKVADALREMAADLVGDHNISTEVTELISDLADAAGRMKQQAERCAEQCGIAKEAARLAATEVARVYGQDMDAKEDAGLKFTSAGRHHD